jgi:hypothetical protein
MEWRHSLKQAEQQRVEVNEKATRVATKGPRDNYGGLEDGGYGDQEDELDLLSSALKAEAERIENEHGVNGNLNLTRLCAESAT